MNDLESPLLDGCYGNNNNIYSALLNGKIMSTTITLDEHINKVIGTHTDGVKCIEYDQVHNTLISGSWDCSIKVWDPKSNMEMIQSKQDDGKIYIKLSIIISGWY